MANYGQYDWVIESPETKQNIIEQGPQALPSGWSVPFTYTYEGNTFEKGIAISGFGNLTNEELRYYGWLPHVLIDPPHTWIDKFIGSVNVIEPTQVVETNQYVPKTPEEIAEDLQPIKDEGKTLLADSDWTDIPATGDATKSNPYLANQSEFTAWRSQVRYLMMTLDNPYVQYPPPPVEDWKFTNA